MSATTVRRRLVRDLLNGRIGEIMAENVQGTKVYLRPVGGGLEWETPVDEVEDVEPVLDSGDAA